MIESDNIVLEDVREFIGRCEELPMSEFPRIAFTTTYIARITCNHVKLYIGLYIIKRKGSHVSQHDLMEHYSLRNFSGVERLTREIEMSLSICPVEGAFEGIAIRDESLDLEDAEYYPTYSKWFSALLTMSQPNYIHHEDTGPLIDINPIKDSLCLTTCV